MSSINTPDKKLRLDLYLVQAELASRRKADELIRAGEITVNHYPITDPTYIVKSKDTVRYKKKILQPKTIEYVYILLHKPAGYVTTASDDTGRLTVFHLIADEAPKTRLFCVGRLDINTTGILLMTNDGDVAHKLAHPRYEVEKVYQVILDKALTDEDQKKILSGIRLTDGPIKADKVEIGHNPTSVRITIHSGRNRIIRRIFESQGYTVEKLERIGFAGLSKKGLAHGEWRMLRTNEIAALKKQVLALTTTKSRS